MDKRRIRHHKCVQMVNNERKFLSTIQNVYVLQLKFAYTTYTEVSLVFDLMMGGSLDYHIKKRVFNPMEAVYYAARYVTSLMPIHIPSSSSSSSPYPFIQMCSRSGSPAYTWYRLQRPQAPEHPIGPYRALEASGSRVS